MVMRQGRAKMNAPVRLSGFAPCCSLRRRALALAFGKAAPCSLPLLVGTVALFLHRAGPLFTRVQEKLDELNALMYLAMAAIILIGAHQVSFGATSAGTVVAALTYLTQMLNGILMLVMVFMDLARGRASWTRLSEVLSCQPEIVSPAGERGCVAEPKASGAGASMVFRDVAGSSHSRRIRAGHSPGGRVRFRARRRHGRRAGGTRARPVGRPTWTRVPRRRCRKRSGE